MVQLSKFDYFKNITIENMNESLELHCFEANKIQIFVYSFIDKIQIDSMPNDFSTWIELENQESTSPNLMERTNCLIII